MKQEPTPSITTAPLRDRAETRLLQQGRKNHAGNGATRSLADTQRLLHELQVHQIELEMQNEELRKARDEMEAGMEKYSELYDFAPLGYLTLDPEGVIREANLTAASLLGIPRAPLVKQRLGHFVTAADRQNFDAFLRQVFESRDRKECDLRLFGKDKATIDVRMRANLSESREVCRLALTDITQHKQAEEKVRVSEIRYRRLFEAAQDGVLLLDPTTCKITDANPFMTKLLGYPHDRLVGKELFEIGLLKDETASQEMFRKLKRKHEVRYEDLPLESQDGRHQEVEVVANLYEENGQAVIQCNIRDITERKKGEAALRQSEERYRSLFNSIDEGFCVIEMIFDKKGKPVDYRFLEVNPSFEMQSGIHNGQGRLISEIDPKLEAHWFEAYGKVALTGNPMRFSNEAKGLNRWFDVYALRIGGEGSRKVAVLFNNITVRKQVEQALHEAQKNLADYAGQLEILVGKRTAELMTTNVRLKSAVVKADKSKQQYMQLFLESQLMQVKLRDLTRQIITAQEDERKEISRELHDQVVQILVGISVHLSALGAGVSEGLTGLKGLKGKITRTQQLVEVAVNAVHRFARELRPAVLDDLGLIPALHAYNKSLAEQKNLKIHLTAFAGVEALESSKRTVLFRVAQEAMTNVIRHARASQVRMSLTKIPGAVRMEINDNGKSFQVGKTLLAKTNKRLGLVGMRERVEMVGGSLTIESAPGRGTTVRAELPFTQEKSNP